MSKFEISPENLYKFIKTDNLHEVEFRFKFSKEQIIKFLTLKRDELINNCSINKTVNIIYVDQSKNKKDFVISKNFDNNTVNYYTKQKKLVTKISGNIILNVSRETPSSQAQRPANQDNFLVRIKNRLEIPYRNGRFDITQISQMDRASINNSQLISQRKVDLFKPVEGYEKPDEIYDAFLRNMNNSAITSVEMEYEFTNLEEPNQLTINFIHELLGYDYSVGVKDGGILSEIAVDIGSNTRRGVSLKTMLNNATCLTSALYNRIYPPIDWYLTPKADGYVGLAVFGRNGKNYLIYTETVEVEFHANGYTILVGEVVDKTFYCFDALMIEGENIMQLGFSRRLEAFMKFIVESIKFGEFTIKPKEFILITSDLQRSFKSAIELPVSYETDGFILVSPNNTYQETKNYKIKEHNTIDFLVVECPDILKKEQEIYQHVNGTGGTFLLFSTITDYELKRAMIQPLRGYNTIFNQRFGGVMPIQFCPSDNPLAYIWHASSEETKILRDVKTRIIAEFDYDNKKENWKLIKIRDDRVDEPNYYGNHLFKVAEPSWMAMKYPFTLEQMANPLTNYFGTGKDMMYKAQTAFNSYVKSKILSEVRTVCQSKVAVDLAAGKGQDLRRYYENNFTKTLFCDIDPVALSELVTRRFEIMRDKHKKNTMAVQTLLRDLNLPADQTLEIMKPLISSTNIGLVVCNFAIHYLIYDIDHLRNFMRLILGLSTPGTMFYFTTMSGKAVLDLLSDANEWKCHQNGVLKYHIVKKFKGTTLTDFGQTIATKMPFSNELFEENLVNIDFVNGMFEKVGFKLIESQSFKKYLSRFENDSPSVYGLLSEDDKTFASLYHYSIFKKI